MAFRITWRVGEGSFYEQVFIAASLAKAKARWRYYTGYRQKDCTIFNAASA